MSPYRTLEQDDFCMANRNVCRSGRLQASHPPLKQGWGRWEEKAGGRWEGRAGGERRREMGRLGGRENEDGKDEAK